MRPSPRQVSTVLALLLSAGSLGACGASTERHALRHTVVAEAKGKTSPNPDASSTDVVVRVGRHEITRAEFDRRLIAEVHSEAGSHGIVPDPPGFTHCIAALGAIRAREGKLGASLKGECSRQYSLLKREALSHLIVSYWLIGGAAEARAPVSNAEVAQILQRIRRQQYPTAAAFSRFLSSSSRTIADLELEIRAEQSAEGIREAIKRSVGTVTPARAARYYRAHEHTYATPEHRNLKIVRTSTRRAATIAKHKLAAGESFASVAAGTGVTQPIFSSHGLVVGLKPRVYSEPRLDRAIFEAPLNRLEGPIGISLGYYVFEVKKIVPGRKRSLAEVSQKIKASLPAELEKAALMAFIKKWRTRWTHRTNCRPAFVVEKCRQFKVPPGAEPPDPYTLN